MHNLVISKVILTRTTKEIPWGFRAVGMPEIHKYIKDTYSNTGKLLVRGTTISDDELICIHSSQWRSEEDRNEYNNDPIIKEKNLKLKKYWGLNNIKVRWERTEFKDGAPVKKLSGVLV